MSCEATGALSQKQPVRGTSPHRRPCRGAPPSGARPHLPTRFIRRQLTVVHPCGLRCAAGGAEVLRAPMRSRRKRHGKDRAQGTPRMNGTSAQGVARAIWQPWPETSQLPRSCSDP